MLTRLGKVLVVPALILLLGAHWGIFQSAAWVGMILSYTRQAGLAEAISMTFDGQHPCALCKAIQEGKSDERRKQREKVAPAKELDLGLPPRVLSLLHPPVPGVPTRRSLCPGARVERPPLPPPRAG